MMRFERLDLNLLVALDVLIEERSVSGAAKRLNLSQPAVSGALSRLREFFGDDLLVQSGRHMVPTPIAEGLVIPVREALTLIKTRITTIPVFDPKITERNFSIIASDYMFITLLADCIAEIASDAPGLGFEILPPDPRSMDKFERGEIDLLITLDTHLRAQFPREPLFTDEYVVICWSEGPHAQSLDAETFLNAGHVVVYFGPTRNAFAEEWFEQQGTDRRIEIRVPSFMHQPMAVIGTSRVATMQRRFAEFHARHLPLAVLPLPFPIPPINESLQWHPMRNGDQGLRWLANRIQSAAAVLVESAAR